MLQILNYLIKTLSLGTKYLLNEHNSILCTEKEMIAALKHITIMVLKEKS